MELYNINPHIRFAKHFESTTFNNILRCCYDCRLFYIKEGNGSLKVNNQIYKFSNDTVFYFPPGTAYRLFFEKKDSVPVIIIFNFDLIDNFAHLKDSLGTADESNFNPQKIITYDLPKEFSDIIVTKAPLIYEKLKKCTNEFLYKDSYYRHICSANLKACLFEILRQNSLTSEFKIIPQLTKYIHENYASPELTNEKIAKKFGYHPYYLSQLMKQATGETLHTYLLHYRIRIAKDHLITTNWEINTIAWKCGFNSTSYFIKQFRQRTGVTPHQFRKLNKNLVL